MSRHSKRLPVSTGVKPGDVLPPDLSERDGPTHVVTRKVHLPEPKGEGPFFEERLKIYHAGPKTRDVRVPVWPKFPQAPAHVLAELTSRALPKTTTPETWDLERLVVRLLDEPPKLVLPLFPMSVVHRAHREGFLAKGKLTDEGREYALAVRDDVPPVLPVATVSYTGSLAYEPCALCGVGLLEEHRAAHARHHDQWFAFHAHWTEPRPWHRNHRLWTVGLTLLSESDPLLLLAVLGEENQPANP